MFHSGTYESTIYLAECDCSVQESIEEDFRKLKAFQGDFCDKGPRCFKRVCHTSIFVFLHGTHLACSRVLYSMFKAVLDISSSVHELLKYYEKKGPADKQTELKRCEKLSRTEMLMRQTMVMKLWHRNKVLLQY